MSVIKAQDVAVNIEAVQKAIDIFLGDFFADRIRQAEAIDSDYAQLWRTVAILSGAGGKRIRPYITLLAYNASSVSSATNASIFPAAVAQELLHQAMLIHDDIIDRDQLRYGIKNITGQYGDIYKKYVADDAERLHFSTSAALLAGDLLIAESYGLMQQCDIAPESIAAAQSLLSRSIFHVVGGELLDTESAFRPFDSVDAKKIALQKTASYSFVGPLLMGATLANASSKTLAQFEKFGNALGFAYQLADDLLGVFGQETTTGKSTSGDIKEGKHTYMIEQFYQLASDEQKQEFETVFKNHQASDEMVARARLLLVESGARQATQEMIDKYSRLSHEILEDMDIDSAAQGQFTELIKKCTVRQK